MSNKLVTLNEVYDRVDKLSENCYDRLIPVKDVEFESLSRVKIGYDSHYMKRIAQRSIANRLGIPYQYLEKCPAELQKKNLDYWIEKERNDELFFRMNGDQVRAIFTPKYSPVDNFEVMERLDSIGYDGDTLVQCHLDEEFMSLNIPDPERTFSINGDNDKVRQGISIANSEVGLSSLKISAFLLRLVCTNGLVTRTEVDSSYRHVSRRVLEEFESVVNEVSRQLGQHKRQFAISKESPVLNPEETMKNFNRQYQLNEKERDAAHWGLYADYGKTMFHVINGYTRGAQSTDLPAESRHRLQVVGGNILSMVNDS